MRSADGVGATPRSIRGVDAAAGAGAVRGPLLSLDHVGKRHRAGRQTVAILDDVSVDILPGEVIAIWGARRSGKTTLLRVAAGVELPSSGVVRLDGADLTRLSSGERTRRLREVGYAPKDWRVASGRSMVDHVALPLLADGRPLASALARAHEAMERVGALELVRAPAHELSLAELARVTIARAIVRGPRLLLADEPAATAEREEREQIMRLLRSLAVERPELAIVLTSQDAAGIGAAGRVMSIGGGQLRTFEDSAAVIPLPIRPSNRAEPVS